MSTVDKKVALGCRAPLALQYVAESRTIASQPVPDSLIGDRSFEGFQFHECCHIQIAPTFLPLSALPKRAVSSLASVVSPWDVDRSVV